MKPRPSSLLLVVLLGLFAQLGFASSISTSVKPSHKYTQGLGHGLKLELDPSFSVEALMGFKFGDQIIARAEDAEYVYAEAFAKYKVYELITGLGMTTNLATQIRSSSMRVSPSASPVMFTEYRDKTWALGLKWAAEQAEMLDGRIVQDQSLEAYISLELM